MKLIMLTATELRKILPSIKSNDTRVILVIRPLLPRFSQASMVVEARSFLPLPGDLVTWEGTQYKIEY